MKSLLRTPYNKLIIISLLVYLTTAYFSTGNYHPDEHFQIIEFCNYKLGNLPAQYLPWEFQEQMRPTLQPIIALVIIKTLNAISIFDPFIYSLYLRLITAILAWFILYKISFLLIENFSIEASKKIFIFLSFLFGFVPFLNVRFSSENYSAIAFLGAIYFIIKYRFIIAERIVYKLFFVGLLLGFSFFFRFQMVLAIFGLGMWLLIINKTRWYNLIIIVVSGAITISICIILDSWFYGKLVFTPYNYYYVNIVQNKAAEFGIEPWWYYFPNFIQKVTPIFGILLTVSFFIGLIKRPKDLIVWCILPFIGTHLIVSHKELRFLLPMIFLFTYLVVSGIEQLISFLKIKRYGHIIFIVIIVCNIPALINHMFIPADKGLYCYKYLYDKHSSKKAVIISREIGIIHKWGLKKHFYESPSIKSIELKNDNDFNNYLDTCKLDTIYVLERKLITERKYNGYINRCVLKFYPNWILRYNINNWQSRASILNLQELIKIKT